MLHRRKLDKFKKHFSLVSVLKRIDMNCIIFFIGMASAIVDSVPLIATSMGLEKIHFFWHARKIGGLAALGYFSGILVYMIQHKLLHS